MNLELDVVKRGNITKYVSTCNCRDAPDSKSMTMDVKIQQTGAYWHLLHFQLCECQSPTRNHIS